MKNNRKEASQMKGKQARLLQSHSKSKGTHYYAPNMTQHLSPCWSITSIPIPLKKKKKIRHPGPMKIKFCCVFYFLTRNSTLATKLSSQLQVTTQALGNPRMTNCPTISKYGRLQYRNQNTQQNNKLH